MLTSFALTGKLYSIIMGMKQMILCADCVVVAYATTSMAQLVRHRDNGLMFVICQSVAVVGCGTRTVHIFTITILIF